MEVALSPWLAKTVLPSQPIDAWVSNWYFFSPLTFGALLVSLTAGIC